MFLLVTKSTKAAKDNKRSIEEEDEPDEHDLPASTLSKNCKRSVPNTGADLKPNAKKKKAPPKQAATKKKKTLPAPKKQAATKKKVPTPSPKKQTATTKKITTPSPKNQRVTAASKSVVEPEPPSSSDSEDGDNLYGPTEPVKTNEKKGKGGGDDGSMSHSGSDSDSDSDTDDDGDDDDDNDKSGKPKMSTALVVRESEVLVGLGRRKSIQDRAYDQLHVMCQECAGAGIDTSVLKYFSFRQPKKFLEPTVLNFMCHFNNCGFVDIKDCGNPLFCCHKAFSVPHKGKRVTSQILRSTFHRNPAVTNIMDAGGKPPLCMRWDRAMTFNKDYLTTSSGFASWKCGTVQKHMKDCHQRAPLPYALYKISDQKGAPL